jgi:hypothetical protein
VTGHGLHFDTHCPTCDTELRLTQQRQNSTTETVGVLVCGTCRVEWVVQVRLALGARLPKTRNKAARYSVPAATGR